MGRDIAKPGRTTLILLAVLLAAFPALGDPKSNYEKAADLAQRLASAPPRGATGSQLMLFQLQQNAAKQAAQDNERGARTASTSETAKTAPAVSPIAFPQLPAQLQVPDLTSSSSASGSEPVVTSGGAGGDSQLASIQQYEDQIRETNRKVREADSKVVDAQILAIQQNSATAIQAILDKAKRDLEAFAPVKNNGGLTILK